MFFKIFLKSTIKIERISNKQNLGRFFCGEQGIRTLDTLLGYTHFPGVPLKPLEHLSNGRKFYILKWIYKIIVHIKIFIICKYHTYYDLLGLL
jgi:hypothetical protein